MTTLSTLERNNQRENPFPAQSIISLIDKVKSRRLLGKISSVRGDLVEAPFIQVELGELCYLLLRGVRYHFQVIHFKNKVASLMPLEHHPPLYAGMPIYATGDQLDVYETEAYLGRVVDYRGNAIDGKESLRFNAKGTRDLSGVSSHVLKRRFIKERLYTGIRAIDGLLTLGIGQRLGIFAGSGVGKSTCLSMIAKHSSADVNVVVLVGERGREVKEFIDYHLGEEGMKKSVMVVSTAGEPAMARVRVVETAMTIAEYFRDCGKKVLLLMDSLTRLAMAQREIGILMGEPPTSRAYTPSVFSKLASIIERGGNGSYGSITAFYTVLVEGDDLDEPISDAVRGMLDGHIVLSRKLAEKGHFPAIDVPSSISRLMPDILEKEEYEKPCR